jgi:hypothetical protein
MKRLLLTTSTYGLLAFPAMAADMAPFYRAPPPVAIASWTGPYVGATLGSDWTGSNVTEAVGATFCNPAIAGCTAGPAASAALAAAVPRTFSTSHPGAIGGGSATLPCGLLPYTAGIIQTCGVSDNSHTGRTNGLHLLRGAVRDVTVECERLLEPNEIAVAPAGKLRTLDLVEPIIGKENRGRGEITVRSGDAELPPINPVDAVGDVDLQLAALRHSLDGLFDDRGLLQAGIAAIHDGHREQVILVASRIDTGRHHFARNDLKHRHLFDVRIGWEDDSEAFGNRVEFLPLCGGGTADDNRCQTKAVKRIFDLL